MPIQYVCFQFHSYNLIIQIYIEYFLFLIIKSYIYIVKNQVGDLGYASELGNYAEYSGAPNEEEVLQYARVVIDVSHSIPINNNVRKGIYVII